MVAPDHSGRRVGGFELIEPLASGGFATVYRARQVRLDREVAVKVLDPALARDPDIAARFEREGRAAASLDHPNVVAVYEAGEDDGLVYLAMRLVKGETLDDLLLRGGPLSVARTVEYIAPVADALDHAHEGGLIHRDVKPSNIFIDNKRVWLGDFGIAATADQVGRYTTGTLGTAHYMAPEQASAGELDGRADLYALGCVVHRCLTGRPPYDRGELVATLVAHVNEPVPTLGHAGLDRFLAMALAKAPEDRFATGADLVASLRSVGPVDVPGLLEAGPTVGVSRDAATGAAGASPAPATSARGPAVPPLPPPVTGAQPGPPPVPPPSTIAPMRVGSPDDATVPPIAEADAPITRPSGPPNGASGEGAESGGRPWLWLLPALALVAVLAAGGWFLVGRDDGAGGGGSNDDRSGVATSELADPIAVGAVPLIVAIDDASVLVASTGSETLTEVPMNGATPVESDPLGAPPSDVHAAGGLAWVTTRDPTRSVIRFELDPGEGSSRSSRSLPLGFEAARVSADEDGAWVSDPDGGRVLRLDRDGDLLGAVAIDGAPTDMVLAAGSLWVSDTGSGTVVRIDPDRRAIEETIDIEGGAGAITGSDEAIYIVDRPASTMTRIDIADTSVQTTVSVAASPTRPEVGAGGVWLISPTAGTAHRYDVETLEEIQSVDVGGPLGGLAIDGDDLWTTRRDDGELVKVALAF